MKPVFVSTDLENNAIRLTQYKHMHFSRPLHYHAQLELTLITESTGVRFLGNHIESFADGDLILVGTNVPHVWRNDEFYYKSGSPLSAGAISIFFEETLVGDKLMMLNEFKDIANLIKQSKRGVKITGDLKKEITATLKNMAKTNASSIVNPAEQLLTFLKILHDISISKEVIFLMDEPWNYTEKHQEKLKDIYEYLLNNLSRDISMTEVAEKVSFHPVSLGRFIKQHTGKTFVQILNSMRINYACKLLKESNASIPVICNQSGFNNVANFVRQFKEFTGKTPLNYKKSIHS